MSTGPTRTDAGRPTWPVRLVIVALLWAGPIGIALAAAVLIASASFFRHGPGTPSAGDERAWNAIWTALALVGAGCAVGLIANSAWLAYAWHRTHRPTRLQWFRATLNLLLGAGLLWLWFVG